MGIAVTCPNCKGMIELSIKKAEFFAPVEKAVKKEPESGLKPLIDAFFVGLKTKLGEVPSAFNGGAAGKGFKKLLRTYPHEEIHRRMGLWFASEDQFVAKRGWRVEDFFGYFNQLKDNPLRFGFQKPAESGLAAPVKGKYDNLG